MRTHESTGRNIEEAISAGLKLLNVDIGDVTIDILEEGSKGLFGFFGSRPARVRLTVKEDEREDTRSVFASSLDEDPVSDAPAYEAPTQSARKQSEKTKPAEKTIPAEKKTQTDRNPATGYRQVPDNKQSSEMRQPPEKKQSAENRPVSEKKPPAENRPVPEKKQPSELRAAPVKKQNDSRKPDEKKKPEKKAILESSEPRKTVPVVPAEQADRATIAGRAQEFLQKLTNLMGVDVSVAVSTDAEGNVRANMDGDTQGILIGRRGETLDALQYLVSLAINKGCDEYTRITLDTEGYRARREEALIRLANRMANRAQKTGRRVSMEPMNPYERRILHSALQNNTAVATHSEGEEPNRHVVITLNKSDKNKAASEGEKAGKAETPVTPKAPLGFEMPDEPEETDDSDDVDISDMQDETEQSEQ